MNKKIKNTFVPRLRFPEFREAGEWEEKTLGEMGEFKNGINFSVDKKGSGILTIDVLNMYGEGVNVNIDSLYRVNIDASEYFLQNDDILFVRSSMKREGVGWTSLFKKTAEPVVFCGFLIRLRLSTPTNNPEFLVQYLRSTYGRDKIIAVAGTAAITNVSQDSLKTISIHLPIPPEQQKIAATLTALDDLIRAQQEKISALQRHKKGLMQQLFPAEGERVPKVRFGEFEGEWEERRLGGICTSFSGGTPDTTKKEFYGGTIPFIRSAEINKRETELFLTEEGLKNSSAKLVSKGSVLVALYGANSGDVALAKTDGAINQAILCLNAEASNPFICQFLTFKKDWIVSTFIQGGQGNLSGDIIKSINLYFPSLPEQQKIAAALSSLDELLAAQSQKLEALRRWKQGLMQGLFPNVHET